MLSCELSSSLFGSLAERNEANYRASQPLIELCRDETKRPRVSQRFFVRSTLGPDQFNCIQLDNIRRAGFLKGDYSCQNNSIGDQSGISRAPGAKFLGALLIFITISLQNIF
jgi:hypothetical protein